MIPIENQRIRLSGVPIIAIVMVLVLAGCLGQNQNLVGTEPPALPPLEENPFEQPWGGGDMEEESNCQFTSARKYHDEERPYVAQDVQSDGDAASNSRANLNPGPSSNDVVMNVGDRDYLRFEFLTQSGNAIDTVWVEPNPSLKILAGETNVSGPFSEGNYRHVFELEIQAVEIDALGGVAGYFMHLYLEPDEAKWCDGLGYYLQAEED